MKHELREWIDLVVEGEYIPPPPEYDPEDDEHREASARTGFWGEQAAGCVFFARSTNRLLLMFRSSGVKEPHTWGNCGGAYKASEAPVVAARREGREETGYSGEMQMVPLYVFQSGTFHYSNYLAIIDEEFEPDLGWEAEDYAWCDWGDWPHPLHFGLKALFADAASVAKIKALIAE